MEKKIFFSFIIFCVIISSLTAYSIIVHYQNIELQIQLIAENEKSKFLENALAKKNLEYEWLAEIMEQVLKDGKVPNIPRTPSDGQT